MREFSVPASLRVDDGDTLSDAVFATPRAYPSAVALRRRGPDGSGPTSPPRRSRPRSSRSPAA